MGDAWRGRKGEEVVLELAVMVCMDLRTREMEEGTRYRRGRLGFGLGFRLGRGER